MSSKDTGTTSRHLVDEVTRVGLRFIGHLQFINDWRDGSDPTVIPYGSYMSITPSHSLLRRRLLDPLHGWNFQPLVCPSIDVGEVAVKLCHPNTVGSLDPRTVAWLQSEASVRPLPPEASVMTSLLAIDGRQPWSYPEVFSDLSDHWLTELFLSSFWDRATETAWVGIGPAKPPEDAKSVGWDIAVHNSLAAPQRVRRWQQVVLQAPNVTQAHLGKSVQLLRSAVFMAACMTEVGGSCVFRIPNIILTSNLDDHDRQIQILFAYMGSMFSNVRPFHSAADDGHMTGLCVLLEGRRDTTPSLRFIQFPGIMEIRNPGKFYNIAYGVVQNTTQFDQWVNSRWEALSMLLRFVIKHKSGMPKYPDCARLNDQCACSICSSLDDVPPRTSSDVLNTPFKVYAREFRFTHYMHQIPSTCKTLWVVGCGYGAILKYLVNSDVQIVAFDVDQAAIDAFSAKAASLQMQDRVLVVRADLNCGFQARFWLTTKPPDFVDLLWSFQHMQEFVKVLDKWPSESGNLIPYAGAFFSPRKDSRQPLSLYVSGQHEVTYTSTAESYVVKIPSFHRNEMIDPKVDQRLLKELGLYCYRLTQLLPAAPELAPVADLYMYVCRHPVDTKTWWLPKAGSAAKPYDRAKFRQKYAAIYRPGLIPLPGFDFDGNQLGTAEWDIVCDAPEMICGYANSFLWNAFRGRTRHEFFVPRFGRLKPYGNPDVDHVDPG